RSSTLLPPHHRGTFDAGSHPGPESMVTTVPTGPELGVSVTVAARLILFVREAFDLAPVAVMVWFPKVGGSARVVWPDPVASVLKLSTGCPPSNLTCTVSEAPNPVTESW